MKYDLFVSKVRILSFLGLIVFINGCASLDEQLISRDGLTRRKAEQKLFTLPTVERNAHLETLVRHMSYSCGNDSTASDFNILSIFQGLGPIAKHITPSLLQLYSACQMPSLRAQINNALISIEGTDVDGLNARKEALCYNQATEPVLKLINEIKEVEDPSWTPTWSPHGGFSNREYILANLFGGLINASNHMTPKDWATIPFDAIIKPIIKSTPESSFEKSAVILLIKIGSPSIPLLKQWLADITTHFPRLSVDDIFAPYNRDKYPIMGIHRILDALKEIGTPEALAVITAYKDDLARKDKQTTALR